MAVLNLYKSEAETSKMAIKTKAESTSIANSKYKNPKPRIPATDPKQIQSLWIQVRKRNSENMPRTKDLPKYMAGTKASASKDKTANYLPSRTPTTTLSSKTQALTIKSPEFREKCLTPRGIVINNESLPFADPCAHFNTEKPSSYSELAGLKESTLWLDAQPAFLEKVNKEYRFMDCYQLCETEYASFATENLLKREPREMLFDSTEDPSRRFRRAERMLEFTCKPDRRWTAPPILDKQYYPTYAFDIRPDCNYWLTLHAFSSAYVDQAKAFVHVAQKRMTCPYFTVEFKRDDTDITKAENQVATFGALALYNRYRLRELAVSNKSVSDKWTHEQECQLRHYALTIAKSSYTFWCIRPKLNQGNWVGCYMDSVFFGDLDTKQGVIYFVDWINEIHRWGLTNHITSCETDIKALSKKQNFRTSEGGLEKECTCGNSSDAADTSGQDAPDAA